MSGRLFNAGHAAIGRAAKDRLKRERIAIFAEVLSDIGEVKATGKALGVAQSTATLYFKQIRDDLGWQAQ